VLDNDDDILVPPCWDGTNMPTAFHAHMNQQRQQKENPVWIEEDTAVLDELDQFQHQVNQQTMFVKCFALTLGLPMVLMCCVPR